MQYEGEGSNKHGNWLMKLILVIYIVLVIRCWPKVFAPPGGKMICSNSNIYGSKCVFSCHHGYRLEGSLYRVCEKNGTKGYWTGNETKCKCKSIYDSNNHISFQFTSQQNYPYANFQNIRQ